MKFPAERRLPGSGFHFSSPRQAAICAGAQCLSAALMPGRTIRLESQTHGDGGFVTMRQSVLSGFNSNHEG